MTDMREWRDSLYWLASAITYREAGDRRRMRKSALLVRACVACLAGDYSTSQRMTEMHKTLGQFIDLKTLQKTAI